MQAKTFNSFGNWELRKKLGAGGFGEVILWKNRINQMEIATKSLNQNEQLGCDEVTKLKERWTREIEFMCAINADFIVRAVILDDKAFVDYLNERHAWRPLPVLTMEYCNGGDLRTHLKNIENLNGLCEFEIREVMRSLRNAVDYMHNKCKIKHRDLKPDNIVIHKMSNGKKIYKLTDFGLARYINDATMLQSVVGTRNYFAPEIVDTSGYTKTVDYWSVGVMAFEMLCGVLPFIPHRSLYHKIKEIRGKPENCIAITEDLSKPELFHTQSTIYDENRVSNIFRNEMEKWLRLCLDVDYRTRGTSIAGLKEVPSLPGGRVLRFYSNLDAALNIHILTIFNLNSYRYCYYQLDEETVFGDFLACVVRDTGIALERLCFILPVGHPLKSVYEMRKTLDLFVEEWCDTNDSTNPPVMLYIADTESVFKPQEPQISGVIKSWFVETDVDEAPNWLIQKLAYDINFLLTNEQRHLSTFLDGLKQFAMHVEDIIFKFEEELKNIIKQAYFLFGRSEQFSSSLAAVLKALGEKQNEFLISCQQKVGKLYETGGEIVHNMVPKLQKRYNSILRRIKAQVSSKLFEELTQKDIYSVANFQRHLQGSHLDYKFDDLIKISKACNKCRQFVNDILEERAKFFESQAIVAARWEIFAIFKEFQALQKAVATAKKTLDIKKGEIDNLTQSFHTVLVQNQYNVETQNPQIAIQLPNAQLTMPSPPIPKAMDTSMISSTINGLCDSFDHLMQIPTKDLIQETHESMRLIAMDLDQPVDDIPTTAYSN